jgi:hypothetical protein
MAVFKVALSISILLLTAILAAAQGSSQSQPSQDSQAAREAAVAGTIERANREAVQGARREMSRPAYGPVRRSNYYNKSMTEAQKKLLSPAPEDAARFAAFLKQSNTGIVKLLPTGKHELSYTVSAQENPENILPIRGGGAFYSFSEKTHSFGPWSEISLHEGHLVVGFAFETLGLLVSLGDLPLESVTLSTPGVDYLAGYTAPKTTTEAKAERNRHYMGFSQGNFEYGAALEGAANKTYAFRSISYRKQGRLSAIFGGLYIPHPFEYAGADVIIAMRVIRSGDDGSVTLLWKRLKKLSTPKLKRE